MKVLSYYFYSILWNSYILASGESIAQELFAPRTLAGDSDYNDNGDDDAPPSLVVIFLVVIRPTSLYLAIYFWFNFVIVF